MASRLKLQEELEEILGSRNVYFQPPESVKMKYDAIVYTLGDMRTNHADDRIYKLDKSYEITVISRNPDNDLAEKLLTHFKHISFDRRFINDNLYHDTLTLYY